MPEQPRVVLLKPLITSPLIEVGEFTYYDDPDDPTGANHRMDGPSTFPFPMIMPGVHIGSGAIVASGSVVVDDVPEYSIVGGNPARVIRRRLHEEEFARLMALAWWDWPLAHTTAHIRTIMSGSIDELESVAPPHS
ncbi:hypothetical protein [Salinispora mooreana]